MFLRPLKSMYAARPRVEARGFQAEVWRRNWCLWLRTGCAKTRGGLRDGGNFRVSIPNGCLSVSAVESAPFARLSCTLSSVSPAPQHTAPTWSWSTDSGNAQMSTQEPTCVRDCPIPSSTRPLPQPYTSKAVLSLGLNLEAECSCLCGLRWVSSLDSELTMVKEEPPEEGPGPWGGGLARE